MVTVTATVAGADPWKIPKALKCQQCKAPIEPGDLLYILNDKGFFICDDCIDNLVEDMTAPYCSMCEAIIPFFKPYASTQDGPLCQRCYQFVKLLGKDLKGLEVIQPWYRAFKMPIHPDPYPTHIGFNICKQPNGTLRAKAVATVGAQTKPSQKTG